MADHTTTRNVTERVELEDDVHQHEQMLLGADGTEFYVHARVKAWLLWFALGIGYFLIRLVLFHAGFDWDVPVFPVIITILLMKIVTPEVPLEAHAMSTYYEARRLVLGWRFRRRTGSGRVGPYALLATASRRPWSKQRRNRTDG